MPSSFRDALRNFRGRRDVAYPPIPDEASQWSVATTDSNASSERFSRVYRNSKNAALNTAVSAPDFIRLVEILHPAEDGTLRCKLREERTSSTGAIQSHHPIIPPQYTCLSYVWGPDAESLSRFIFLDDELHEVRENLWFFLETMSNLLYHGTDDLDCPLNIPKIASSFWIDSLCINQEDVHERNHQVQSMGWIYQNAVQVIAWMGTDFERAQLFSFVNTCSPPLRFEFVQSYIPIIVRLCMDDFFNRAWISQEIILARKVYLFANEQAVDLNKIRHLCLSISRGHMINLNAGFNRYEGAVIPWWQLLDVQHDVRNELLISNMRKFRHKQCSDFHDVVYSLRYISRDAQKLQVDYHSTRAELASSVLNLYGEQVSFRHALITFNALGMTGSSSLGPKELYLSLSAQSILVNAADRHKSRNLACECTAASKDLMDTTCLLEPNISATIFCLFCGSGLAKKVVTDFGHILVVGQHERLQNSSTERKFGRYYAYWKSRCSSKWLRLNSAVLIETVRNANAVLHLSVENIGEISNTCSREQLLLDISFDDLPQYMLKLSVSWLPVDLLEDGDAIENVFVEDLELHCGDDFVLV